VLLIFKKKTYLLYPIPQVPGDACIKHFIMYSLSINRVKFLVFSFISRVTDN
jgi:hypothetical protein